MPLDGTNYTQQQDEVLALLRRARERVAKPGGWCQGVNQFGDSRCAGFSLYEGDWHIATRSAEALVRVLPADYTPEYPNTLMGIIADYNDATGRTQADIVALFDRAIVMREREMRDE